MIVDIVASQKFPCFFLSTIITIETMRSIKLPYLSKKIYILSYPIKTVKSPKSSIKELAFKLF